MAIAKTKTKVIRPLFVEALERKKVTPYALAKKLNVNFSTVYLLINCDREGSIGTWKKIQEVLSLKDNEMWSIINTTKRVNR